MVLLLMVMPRSRSMSIESRIWSRKSRSSTPPQRWISRSARVDLPWSMWAMMQKLRMSSKYLPSVLELPWGDPTPAGGALEAEAGAHRLFYGISRPEEGRARPSRAGGEPRALGAVAAGAPGPGGARGEDGDDRGPAGARPPGGRGPPRRLEEDVRQRREPQGREAGGRLARLRAGGPGRSRGPAGGRAGPGRVQGEAGRGLSRATAGPTPGHRESHSHRNTRDDTAIQTTKTAASAATSPRCADHGSPVQIPWSNDAEWLRGNTWATVRNAGGRESIGTNNPERPIIG